MSDDPTPRPQKQFLGRDLRIPAPRPSGVGGPTGMMPKAPGGDPPSGRPTPVAPARPMPMPLSAAEATPVRPSPMRPMPVAPGSATPKPSAATPPSGPTTPAGPAPLGPSAWQRTVPADSTLSPSLTAGAAPLKARLKTDRDLWFEKYADLRNRLTSSPHDVALLSEAAQVAEDLSLTIEAMELWRECLRVDPSHLEATKRLANLDKRVGATGETGGARTSTFKTRAEVPEARPFWEDLGSALAYPFKGRGLGIFVGASLFFAAGEILATFNVFFGWFVMLCLFGYLAAWQLDVISRTGAGKDDPPEFPELVTVVDSCVLPFVGIAGCIVFSFAPILVILGLMIQGTLSPGVGLIATAVAFVPCGFVFPMSLMVRALTQSIGDSMSPARVYGSILRILPDYIAGFLALSVLWFVWTVVRVALLFGIGITFGLPTADAVLQLDFVRIVGWLVYTAAVWPLLLYVWCVQGHLLGRVYRQSFRRLAWFVRPGAETVKAKELSVALALAGIGGIALLVGGGYLTYLMWPGDRANALLSGGQCPIPAGGELTYFWENTDGPAGLVTYRFDEAAEGRLNVRGTYRMTGDYGVSTMEGAVALIDPKSGRVVRGDGEDSGIHLPDRTGKHTRFFGPRRGSTNSSYLNGWTVRGEAKYRDVWTAWKVVDPDSSVELYYDKATGVLVGRKFPGVGFSISEWLVEAKGVPGIAKGPPANRSFETESDMETPPLGGIEIAVPQPYGMPPR